jgi:DNA topoisomerase IB
MSNFNIFQFQFGKKQRNIFHYVRLGFLFKGTLDIISLLPFVERKVLFNFIDELQLRIGSDDLNDYIIQDEELLAFRIDRILTKVIEEYENNS